MAGDTQLRVGSVSRGLALLVAGAMFMEIMDGTVIAPAAPHIGDSFGVPAVSVNVAITAYVLAVALLIPSSGGVADPVGAPRGVTPPHPRLPPPPLRCAPPPR